MIDLLSPPNKSQELNNDFFQPKVSLTLQTLLLTAASGSSQLAMILLFVWAARSSSLQEFGTISVGIALGGTLVGLLDFGSNTLWVRNLARNELNVVKVRILFFWKLIFSLIAICIFVFAVILAGFTQIAITSGAIAFSFLFNINTLVSLRARGRNDLVSIAVFADRFIAVVTMFGFVYWLNFQSSQALWISLVIGALSSSCISWVVTSPTNWMYPKYGRLLNPWKNSFSFGVSSSSISLQTLDLPISAAVLGTSISGLYAAVNRWVQPLNLFVGSFTQAIAPFVSNAQTFSTAWVRIKKSFWMVYVTLGAAIFLFIFSDQLVALLLGQRYEAAGLLLKILIIGTIPSLISQILLVSLQSLGLEKFVAMVLVPSTMLQLLLVWSFSTYVGIVGVAIAFCIGQSFTLIGLSIVLLFARRGKLLRK